MNEPDIWFKFCSTYEAIYLRFLQWDEWYNNTYANGGATRTIPNMADEWKLYIRVVLNSFVLNARENFRYFAVNRK
jgi:chitinase